MAAAPPPMPKEIEMAPEAVTFFCGNPGKPTVCDVTITNKTAKRAAFKIRCTSATLYRVNPPVGYVKAGEAFVIHIWFRNKEIPESTKQHYFAVHVIFDEATTCPTEVFASKPVKPDGVKRLDVTFSKAAPPVSVAAEKKEG